jgi:hypothetical protein
VKMKIVNDLLILGCVLQLVSNYRLIHFGVALILVLIFFLDRLFLRQQIKFIAFFTIFYFLGSVPTYRAPASQAGFFITLNLGFLLLLKLHCMRNINKGNADGH